MSEDYPSDNDPIRGLPAFAPGSVWIAGAGPGDVGLLTLLAVHGLRHADAVVYDDLVAREALDLAGRRAERIHVGKRGGRPSIQQATINEILVHRARAGQRVLRLKGGDPFVFGRGGEEAMALQAAGIPFRIIPGITAGIGGLAYAGIPVTNRGSNSAVTFVTGHSRAGAVPEDLDWAALAKSPVIVFYMGIGTLPEIATRLLAAGRAPETPLAVVSRASRQDQSMLVTTLAESVMAVRRQRPPSPAIIVLGDVVRLHQTIGWFEPNPQRADEPAARSLRQV